MNIFKLKNSVFKRTKLPPLEIEIILAHVLNKSREFLLAHPELKITGAQAARFKSLILRRKKGEPVAYLTGRKEFYGLDFFVNKQVLIPRPETEMMVEEAIKTTDDRRQTTAVDPPLKSEFGELTLPQTDNIAFIDVGTGSGCIIITLAKILNQKSKISAKGACLPARQGSAFGGKNQKFYATDFSRAALVVARKNAKLHNVKNKIKFLPGNLLQPFLKNNSPLNPRPSSLIILANLPYLTPAQIKKSPTIKHEPRLALSAGLDGLKYYRLLCKQIRTMLISPTPFYQGGLAVLCEIDPSQAGKIKSLIKRELPDARLQIKKDLRGHSRLVIIKTSDKNN